MAINLSKLKEEYEKRVNPSRFQKIKQGAKKIGKEIAKDAFSTLIVKPGTRIGQATAYGIGAIVGGERGERIKEASFQPQKVVLPKRLGGTYDVSDIGKGAEGYRRVGGEALKAASYLYTPGKAAGALASRTFGAAVKQGAMSGALLGGSFAAGQSLQKKDLTVGEFAKETAIGVGAGAAGGAVFGAGGYGLAKGAQLLTKASAKAASQGRIANPKIVSMEKEWQQLQLQKNKTTNKIAVRQIEKAQKSIEAQITRVNKQAGFAKFPGMEDKSIRKIPVRGSEQAPKSTPVPVKGSQKPGLDAVRSASYKDSIGDVSTFYNTDRMNVPRSAKRALEAEIGKQGKLLEQTVGRKLSNKEVLDMAAATSKVLNETVTRDQTKAKIAANLNLRQKLASVMKNGQVDDDLINLWIKDKAAGEDIARQLQARVIKASPSEKSAMEAILESIYKVNKNADDIINAAKGVNFKDPNQVTKFYRSFVSPKAGEWVDLLRYNSMLSSPNTHLVNIASNFQGTGILAPIEKTITGAIDAMHSAVSGKPRQHLVGEGAKYAQGYYSNLGKAAKKFWNIARGRELASYVQATEFSDDITKAIPLATGKGGKITEKILREPSRLMEAADQFFTTLSEGGLTKSSQYRAGQGLKALAPEKIKAEAAQRLFRGELGVNQGKILDAMDFLPRKILEARVHENPIVRNIAKFTFPFVKTPINLFKQGIEYSPAGITTLWGATNKTEQLSKFVIGTATATGVATLVSSDRLTFAEPTGEKARNEFRAAGRQPYAVKVGDKWINYSKLHPAIAFNFALVAAVHDAQENKGLGDDEAETVLSTAAKYMNFLADQSYLKSVGDFVATTKGDASGLTRYIGNYPQQLIPFRALMSYIERATDPVQRQVDPTSSTWEKQVQYITSQIPGLAQKDIKIGGSRITPIKRRGPLGAPIENQNRILNMFSPNRVTTEKGLYEDIYQRSQAKKRLDKMKRELRERLKIR